jgi:hypothetical protein
VIRRIHAFAQQRQSTLWRLVIPPVAWAAHFLFSYIYAAVRCAKSVPGEGIGDVRVAIVIATVVALIVVAAAGLVGWSQSRLAGDLRPHQESTLEDRYRFLAISKFLIAGLSFVAILFTAIPAFIFRDCL